MIDYPSDEESEKQSVWIRYIPSEFLKAGGSLLEKINKVIESGFQRQSQSPICKKKGDSTQ